MKQNPTIEENFAFGSAEISGLLRGHPKPANEGHRKPAKENEARDVDFGVRHVASSI
jgi:hypothetical protein